MKTIVSLIFCALLLAALLVGCGSAPGGESSPEASAEAPAETQEPGIAGTWTADLDLTDTLNRALAGDEELGRYLTLDSFGFELLACFEEDGTYSMQCDKRSAQAAVADLKEQMKVALTRYLEDLAKESGLDLTVEELLTKAGITMDDLMAEMDEIYSAEDLVRDMDKEGRYLFEDGRLALSDDPEKEADLSAAYTAVLEGDTLTLTAGGEDSLFSDLYPVVFYRSD